MPRAGHDRQGRGNQRHVRISIYVPRAGHDSGLPALRFTRHISIYVPRAGHSVGKTYTYTGGVLFQFTCPVRGTAERLAWEVACVMFQFTCPVRGTAIADQLGVQISTVSIYVPRAGHSDC